MLLKFVIVLLTTGLTFAAGSLLWPRLTKQPAPPLVEETKQAILQTSLGQEAAEILGVRDQENIQPINPAAVVQNAISTVTQALEQRATQIVIQQAVTQLQNQLDKLSPEQKQEIQDQLCKP